jgi:hypothetical protein
VILHHHTVISHRIDPTEEFIINLDQNKKILMVKKTGLVGQPTNPAFLQHDKKKAVYTIWICYEKNSGRKILLKKAQTHEKLNYGRHPMLRFWEKHNLASKLFLLKKKPM